MANNLHGSNEYGLKATRENTHIVAERSEEIASVATKMSRACEEAAAHGKEIVALQRQSLEVQQDSLMAQRMTVHLQGEANSILRHGLEVAKDTNEALHSIDDHLEKMGYQLSQDMERQILIQEGQLKTLEASLDIQSKQLDIQTEHLRVHKMHLDLAQRTRECRHLIYELEKLGSLVKKHQTAMSKALGAHLAIEDLRLRQFTVRDVDELDDKRTFDAIQDSLQQHIDALSSDELAALHAFIEAYSRYQALTTTDTHQLMPPPRSISTFDESDDLFATPPPPTAERMLNSSTIAQLQIIVDKARSLQLQARRRVVIGSWLLPVTGCAVFGLSVWAMASSYYGEPYFIKAAGAVLILPFLLLAIDYVSEASAFAPALRAVGLGFLADHLEAVTIVKHQRILNENLGTTSIEQAHELLEDWRSYLTTIETIRGQHLRSTAAARRSIEARAKKDAEWNEKLRVAREQFERNHERTISQLRTHITEFFDLYPECAAWMPRPTAI